MSRRTRDVSLGRSRARVGLRRAFTLLELLVSIVIISILLAILIPNLRAARRQARRTVCLSHLRTATLSVISYAIDHNENLPPIGPRRFVPGIDGLVSPRELLGDKQDLDEEWLVGLGWLWERDLADMSALLCPSAEKSNFSRDYTQLPKPEIPVASDYAYGVSIPAGEVMQLSKLRSTAMIADNFVASDLGEGLGLGHWSHRTGYNVAFPDGSVSFYADPDELIAKAKIAYDYLDDGSIWDLLTVGVPPEGNNCGPECEIYQAWLAFSLNLSDPFGDQSQ